MQLAARCTFCLRVERPIGQWLPSPCTGLARFPLWQTDQWLVAASHHASTQTSGANRWRLQLHRRGSGSIMVQRRRANVAKYLILGSSSRSGSGRQCQSWGTWPPTQVQYWLFAAGCSSASSPCDAARNFVWVHGELLVIPSVIFLPAWSAHKQQSWVALPCFTNGGEWAINWTAFECKCLDVN